MKTLLFPGFPNVAKNASRKYQLSHVPTQSASPGTPTSRLAFPRERQSPDWLFFSFFPFVLLVPKLYLGTRMSAKLRFARTNRKIQFCVQLRSQMQFGNEKNEKNKENKENNKNKTFA
jgi:hypothetical protein